MTNEQLDELSKEVIGAAIKVHRNMGPELFEGIYEDCMEKELQLRGIDCQRQLILPSKYKGEDLNTIYKLDMLVGNELILELKSCADLLPVHESQIISYLNLADKRLGLLMNFNVRLMKFGVKRFVRGQWQQNAA